LPEWKCDATVIQPGPRDLATVATVIQPGMADLEGSNRYGASVATVGIPQTTELQVSSFQRDPP